MALLFILLQGMETQPGRQQRARLPRPYIHIHPTWEAPMHSSGGGKHSLRTWEAKAGGSQAASLSCKLSRGVWRVLWVQEPAIRSPEPGAPKLLDTQSRWVRGVGDELCPWAEEQGWGRECQV